MHLAQELVDYIIDFLHDDPATLIRLSLVSKAWVDRTRTHLCKSLKINSRKCSSPNLSHLTPLCRYVKTLTFAWPRVPADSPAILDCFEPSELHTLVIYCFQLLGLDGNTIRRCFAKFPCASVTTLELYDIYPAHRTLLILLSIFPNVDNLTISVNRWWAEIPIPVPPRNNHDDTVQHISPPRTNGSFKFIDPPGQGGSGFNRGMLLRTIATLPLQFQTVSLNIKEQTWQDALIFLNSCSKTVRKVWIELPYVNQPVNWPSVVAFANLEELYFSMRRGDPLIQHVHPLLRSVTSPRLRRVTIELREKEISRILWPLLDETLVGLIKRQKACGNLVVQLSTKADPERIRGYLPRMAREGLLEVFHGTRPDCWA